MTEQPRRLATIVALDVAGFSARTEENEARTTAEIVRLHNTVAVIAEAHQGRVFNTAGDGFMLEFGSCHAAVEAAFELAETCDPKVRVGVHLGDVVVQSNGDLLGHGVNVAARLMAQSAPGSALVSVAVRQALRGPIVDRLISRGALKLDKMNETIEAFAMVSAKTAPVAAASATNVVQPAPVEPADTLPCVGRTRELERIREQVEKAKRGDGSLLLISGEAGVGKTRMTLEAERMARANEFLILRGHCADMDSAPPYQPLLEQIEQAQRMFGPNVMRQSMGENATELGKLIPELRQQYSDIPPYPNLPPEQERRYLLHGVAEFIARSAANQPLMLVFEDLHWADESTCILLRYLAERLKSERVLLVGTYRDGELSSGGPFGRALQKFTRERLAEDIRLSRLAQREIVELLSKRFGQEPPPNLIDLVFSETEGNPFFIEEVIRLLQESDKLLTTDGKFRDDIEIADTEVTRGVRLIIEDRVSRTSPLCREILTFAAVAGRNFPFDLLVKVDAKHDEDDILSAIEEAEAKRLIEDVSQGRIARYRFVHEQIRQALLSGLSLPRRQRLHLRVADALEAIHGSAADKYAGEIGHHMYQAGSAADLVKTAHYLEVAGERAIESFAFEDALRQFDLALSVIEEQGDNATRAKLQSLRSAALHGAERIPQSLDALKQAIALAPMQESKDEFLLQRCRMLLDIWRGSEAVEDLEKLLLRARESGDAKRELDVQRAVARAYYVMSLDHKGYAEKCRDAFESTIALARAQGDRKALAAVLIATGNLIDYWPDYVTKAKANLAEAQEIGKAIGDEETELDVATAGLSAYLGDKAPAEVEHALERLIARRDPIRLNAFYFRMMWWCFSGGRYERCVEICDAGVELAYRIGTLPVQYPTIKALALMELGRFGDAWRSLEQEIADEAHRFGAALRDMGKLQYEMSVGAYEAAFDRAPHVISESRVLVRAWMLRWTGLVLAGVAPVYTGDTATLGRIEALVDDTGYSLGATGKAALALARGDLGAARTELSAADDEYNVPANVGSNLARLQVIAGIDAAQERWDAARANLISAVALAREKSARGRLWRLLGELALVEDKLGSTDAASANRAEARNLLSEIAATIPDETHRRNLAQGLLATRLGLAGTAS